MTAPQSTATTRKTEAALRAARLHDDRATTAARHAVRLLPQQRISLKEALGAFAVASHRRANVSASPGLVQAHAALWQTVLEQADQFRTPAAARTALVPDGVEPVPPPPGETSLLDYVHHAWLRGHADLTSAKRRAHLATNRWLRVNELSSDRNARWQAVADVLAEIPHWEQQLAQEAAQIPSGLCELVVAAAGYRRVGNGWTNSPARSTAMIAALREAFAAQSASNSPWSSTHRPVPVISTKEGGEFSLVLPAPLAHWLTGPVESYRAHPGPAVEADDVQTHAVALLVWNHGAGPSYRDALDTAAAILQPAASS